MATQIRSAAAAAAAAAGACTNSKASFLLFHHHHHLLKEEERRKKNAINVPPPPPPRLTAASSSYSTTTTTTNWSFNDLRRLRTSSSSRSAVRSSGDHVQRHQDAAIHHHHHHHHHHEGGGADHDDHHHPISNPPSNPSSSWSTIRASLLRNGHDHGDDTIDGDTVDQVSRLVHLGALFASWYLFNIYFNIFNKQVLKVFPFPLTISAFQFGVGALLSLLLTITRRRRRRRTAATNLCNVSSAQLMSILPLAIAHTLGSLFTNMSLGMVAVSFTHTIKALEPFFTVVLSALFLGQFPTIWVLSSLVPVVGGVALASLTEVSFNWSGFWSAMASNLANQSRNVLSKKVMVKKEESLDNIALFSIITIMSFFMSVPIALLVEGINFTSFYVQSSSLNLREIYVLSILAALCFHGHQQVSYTILARVSPVSHSVGNCVKRVVVIVSSLLFFRAPVSPVNSLGTAIALAGVFLYSRVTSIRAQASRVCCC